MPDTTDAVTPDLLDAEFARPARSHSQRRWGGTVSVMPVLGDS